MTFFSSPIALESSLDLSTFQCGEESLDYWLQKKAKLNQISGSSRTFISLNEAHEVAGFYCLSAGSISRVQAPKGIQRNSPDPIPVFILGRLAVDKRYQGQGLGASLLQHAIVQAGSGLQHVGASALLVHALNESAIKFYEKFGFTQSGFDAKTLYLASRAIPTSS